MLKCNLNTTTPGFPRWMEAARELQRDGRLTPAMSQLLDNMNGVTLPDGEEAPLRADSAAVMERARFNGQGLPDVGDPLVIIHAAQDQDGPTPPNNGPGPFNNGPRDAVNEREVVEAAVAAVASAGDLRGLSYRQAALLCIAVGVALSSGGGSKHR